MPLTEDATVTFVTGNFPQNNLIEGNFLYVSCWDFAGGIARVAKIDLTTFTYVSTLDIYAADGRASGMAVSGNYLYIAVAESPTLQSVLVKVDLTTFTVSNVLFLSKTGTIMHVATSGNYLYGTCYQGGHRMWKVDLSTFTEVQWAISTGGGGKHPVVHNGFLYYIAGKTLKKATIAPLAEIATLDLGVISHDSACIALIGDTIFTTENGDPSRICKVDLNTFTKTDQHTMSSPFVPDIVVIGGYLYTCHYFSNKVIKVDPSSLSEVEELTLSAAADNLNCISGDSLYVGSRFSPGPGRVTKVVVTVTPFVINKAYALAREEL